MSNRSKEKVIECVNRSKNEGKGNFKLHGFYDLESFVKSIKTPRRIILLVKF